MSETSVVMNEYADEVLDGNKDKAELQKAVERKPNDFQEEILPMISQAGTIQLTPNQEQVLYAPVHDDDVEIRPDGLIYLPWMEYVTRLREAFGMKWALIPQGMPRMKDSLILWGFYLIVDGRLAGYALGEQTYYSGNATMTYGDACEGAKSNARMRLCKDIGIGLELWRPKFIRAWKEKYAESYEHYNKKKGKKEILWRKKDSAAEIAPARTDWSGRDDEPETKIPTDFVPKVTSKWDFLKEMSIVKDRISKATGNEESYYKLLGDNGYEKSNEVPEQKQIKCLKAFEALAKRLESESKVKA